MKITLLLSIVIVQVLGATQEGPCNEENIDYFGYDIKHYVNVIKWEDCRVKCALTNDCTGWTWGSPQSGKYKHMCFTKTSDKGREKLHGFVSGPVRCKKDDPCQVVGVKYVGSIIGWKGPKYYSWKKCSEACRATPKCAKWTQDTNYIGNGNCWLYSRTLWETDRSDVATSGLRNCGIEDKKNECLNNPCHQFASCSDTAGSYTCDCRPGYNGDGLSCYDIDECLTNPCHAKATCRNTVGSYVCTCNTGFSGNGFTCSDYVKGNDGYYYKYHGTKVDWSTADATCRKERAHLAIIETPKTYNYITKMMRSNKYTNHIWIGGRDKSSKDNDWRWVNGNPVADTYWLPMEPNNYFGINEDCMAIAPVGRAEFLDARCEIKTFNFLCQKEGKNLVTG